MPSNSGRIGGSRGLPERRFSGSSLVQANQTRRISPLIGSKPLPERRRFSGSILQLSQSQSNQNRKMISKSSSSGVGVGGDQDDRRERVVFGFEESFRNSLPLVHPQIQSKLVSLPPELIIKILSFLSPSSICRVLPLCRLLHPISKRVLLERVSVCSSNRFSCFSTLLKRSNDPNHKGFTVRSLVLDPSSFTIPPKNTEINLLFKSLPRLQELEFYGFEIGNCPITLPKSLKRLCLSGERKEMIRCFTNLGQLKNLKVFSVQGLDLKVGEILNSWLGFDLRTLKIHDCDGSSLAWNSLLFPHHLLGERDSRLTSLSISMDRFQSINPESWIEGFARNTNLKALELWRTSECSDELYVKNVEPFLMGFLRWRQRIEKLTMTVVPRVQVIRGLGVKELGVRSPKDVAESVCGLLNQLKRGEMQVLAVWKRAMSWEGEQKVIQRATEKGIRTMDSLKDWKWEW